MLYTTAKYAVVGMSEALQIDLAPQGIGVSVLCPGPVATGIIARAGVARPDPVQAATAAQAAKLAERQDYLAKGLSPDLVGDMVRDAILHNRLYVHTHREIGTLIERRTKALLECLPA